LDSKHVAEQTDDPKQRERWMKLAELWAAAARHTCDDVKPGYAAPRGENFAHAKGQPGQPGPGWL
jgi:hypothetical protein